MTDIILKHGREHTVLKRHPWIFSGAIAQIVSENSPAAGETVLVKDVSGKALAVGAFSPESQIAVRVWDFDPSAVIGEDFFTARILSALALRKKLLPEEKSFRLINAESDFLPGIIADKYEDFIVCEFLSAGAEFWKKTITDVLMKSTGAAAVYERSESASRTKEGLPPSTGLLAGEEPPPLITIKENNLSFAVNVRSGHKTGFYLDQRENRRIVASLGKRLGKVLNCFSYTGAFSVYALAAGAEQVFNIDSSEDALDTSLENLRLNNISADKMLNIKGDAFFELRKLRDRGESFDTIILDPPKLAESKSQIDKAARAYKDINLLAFKLLKPGGSLFTFSCSGNISDELFVKIVAGAASDARKNAMIVQRLFQGPDHPVPVSFPEGLYLKGLHCTV